MTRFKAGRRVRVRSHVPKFSGAVGTVVKVTSDQTAWVELDKFPKDAPRFFNVPDKKNRARFRPEHCDEL